MTGYDIDTIDDDLELDTTGAQVEAEAPGEETEVDLVAMAQDVINALPSAESAQITPYQIHSVCNTLLEALGSDYSVRPQMMYNYASGGMIVSGEKGRKRFSAAEVQTFVVKFVTKHTKA